MVTLDGFYRGQVYLITMEAKVSNMANVHSTTTKLTRLIRLAQSEAKPTKRRGHVMITCDHQEVM